MTKQNQPVQSGDTFIAYIDDYTTCVGIIISIEARKARTLILGYMETRTNSQRDDVFGQQFQHGFPSYLTITCEHILPYDFALERDLCRQRNSDWWKTTSRPCYSNLVARHFRPQRLRELQYIDAALHILAGGTIDDYKSFGRPIADETFLTLWAVLYVWFPDKVAEPPTKRRVRGYSNINYQIELGQGENGPTIKRIST